MVSGCFASEGAYRKSAHFTDAARSNGATHLRLTPPPVFAEGNSRCCVLGSWMEVDLLAIVNTFAGRHAFHEGVGVQGLLVHALLMPSTNHTPSPSLTQESNGR